MLFTNADIFVVTSDCLRVPNVYL